MRSPVSKHWMRFTGTWLNSNSGCIPNSLIEYSNALEFGVISPKGIYAAGTF